jgi:hypothetical protein
MFFRSFFASPAWLWGCLYLAAYGAWAWVFRAWVDPWLRRAAGRRLGRDVVWVPASMFPLELWVWGLRKPETSGVESRVALISVAVGLAGAFLPIALLCAFLSWRGGSPGTVSGALYLSTPALVMLFAVFHLQWRATATPGDLAARLDTKHDL